MRVLVVDDSVVYRTALSRALSEIDGVVVAKAVMNGKIAIDYLKQNSDIDLITLDLEMPEMDGFTTVQEIRKLTKKAHIIIFSSMSISHAEQTVQLLSKGADDFIAKVEESNSIEQSIAMIKRELLPRIVGLKERVHPSLRPVQHKEIHSGTTTKDQDRYFAADLPSAPELILMGSSTGGPGALMSLFKELTVAPKIPLLLVQHMPPHFTAKLADSICKNSLYKIKEAKGGEKLEKGCAYIAPGDFHMRLKKGTTGFSLELDQGDKVCHVRPSVDVLFESVAENFKGKVLPIVLTGMGEDGKNGVVKLKPISIGIIAQERESSIVWGMPGAVCAAGVGAKVASLSEIAKIIDEANRLSLK